MLRVRNIIYQHRNKQRNTVDKWTNEDEPRKQGKDVLDCSLMSDEKGKENYQEIIGELDVKQWV